MKSLLCAVVVCLFSVACDKGPTSPTAPTTPIIPLAEPERIVVTVVVDYPPNAGPGILGVTVTCTTGCEGRQTNVTDSQGNVTFTGNFPLTVRAEKPGHVATEQQVTRHGDARIALYNEWPREVHGVARMLRVDLNESRLSIVADIIINGIRRAGLYSCPNVIIWDREEGLMWSGMTHELFHRWQDNSIGLGCSDVTRNWAATTEFAQKYQAAWDNDGKEVLSLDRAGHYKPLHENSPEFFAHWVHSITQDDRNITLCTKAPNRCLVMVEEFGPRPSSFPF